MKKRCAWDADAKSSWKCQLISAWIGKVLNADWISAKIEWVANIVNETISI